MTNFWHSTPRDLSHRPPRQPPSVESSRQAGGSQVWTDMDIWIYTGLNFFFWGGGGGGEFPTLPNSTPPPSPRGHFLNETLGTVRCPYYSRTTDVRSLGNCIHVGFHLLVVGRRGGGEGAKEGIPFS